MPPSSLMKKGPVIGVIPARYGSTRLPAKPLAPICGEEMIRWVIRGAQKASLLTEIWVATDHPSIGAIAESMGVRSVMTPSDVPSGSDRIWAAIQSVPNLDYKTALFVNIQGDEPLVQGEWIDALIDPLLNPAGSHLPMSTVATPFLDLNSEEGKGWKEMNSPNCVKVLRNQDGLAIYFSRFPIPFSRLSPWDQSPGNQKNEKKNMVLKHLGLYAYRGTFLKQFCEQGSTPLERAESLEQLRALYMGYPIYVGCIEAPFVHSVDTPEDLAIVESIIRDLRKK